MLLELLSSIAARVNDSFMDASSLAVVMSPNLTGPPLNILCPMNHTLKMHTAIVKLLIESSHLVGCVPPDIAEKRLLESHSLGSVVGAERGEEVELPERYRKRRKQRTASISGGVWLCVCVLCVCVCVYVCVGVCVCGCVCVGVGVLYDLFLSNGRSSAGHWQPSAIQNK